MARVTCWRHKNLEPEPRISGPEIVRKKVKVYGGAIKEAMHVKCRCEWFSDTRGTSSLVRNDGDAGRYIV